MNDALAEGVRLANTLARRAGREYKERFGICAKELLYMFGSKRFDCT